MHWFALWLAMAAAPFWETKTPQDWSQEELQRILHDSPWAQTEKGALVILASARPVQDAERELVRRRKKKPGEEAVNEDYQDFLREDRGRHIVVAIPNVSMNALAEAREADQMERESFLKVGKKKYKMTGHFPPTPSDPYLRLIYPRAVGPADKTLAFELYLPGVNPPFVMVEFRVKDLMYRGVPEM